MRAIAIVLLLLTVTASAAEFGPELPVTPPDLEPAGVSSAAVATDGVDFLVAWAFGRAQSGVYATRVTASGDVLDRTGIRLGDISPYQTFIPITVLYADGNYVVIWFNADTIMFARIDRDGRVVTPAKAVGHATYAYGSHYAATDGSRIIVAYITAQPRFMVLTAYGDVIRDAAIPTRPPNNNYFTAASNGSEFVLAWNESTRGPLIGIDGVRVARDGAVLDEPKPLLPGETPGYYPLIVSDGADFLLLYQYSGKTMAERISSTLAIGASVPSVSTDAVVWNGSQYLALSTTATSRVIVALDREGRPQGDSKPISAGSAIAIAAGRALIAWSDPQGIGHEMVTDAATFGAARENVLTYTAHAQKTPSLAFSGRSYLAAWLEHGVLVAGRISTDGQQLDGLGIRVTDRPSSAPAVLFNGTSYVIAWSEVPNVLRVATVTEEGTVSYAPALQTCGAGLALTNGPAAETLLLSGACGWRLDVSGRVIGSTQFSPAGENYAAAWNGSEYLIAWNERVYYGVSQYPSYTVRAARFRDSLVPIDAVPIDVMVTPGASSYEPSVASDGNEFAIVFTNGYGIARGVHLRHLSPSGALLDDLDLGVATSRSTVTWDGTRYFVSYLDSTTAIGTYADPSPDPVKSEGKDIAANVESLSRAVRVYDGAVAIAYSRIAPEPLYAGADRIFIRTMLPPSRRRTLRRQSLANGWWTGDRGVGIQVQSNGMVSIAGGGCTTGSFANPQIVGGGFTAQGAYGTEFGPLPPHWSLPPATFRGWIEGSRVRLKVELASGAIAGPWVLEFDGAEPRHPVGGPCP